ncbi:MAG: class I tRNA ligase family protein [Candidatus Taylorbacteria bacterium]|nr:class I tRNA ligase family protein [Candidatus Taylorbacteria bacterium]
MKSEETDIEIIKDLARRGLLFTKEKWNHSYPHCWRCATPLIYFARDSWYIAMSKLRRQLVKENQKINWEPPYIKDGRFGEWLKEVKDWAISRERYWGAPLPVWQCASCDKRQVVGSFEELFRRGKNKKLTRLVLVRHGESQKNIIGIFDSSRDRYPLTERGEKNAKVAAKQIKKMGGVDAIFASPVLRARQTAAIIGKVVGKEPVFSDALWEVKSGEWDGQKDSVAEAQPDRLAYNKLPHDIYYKTARGKTGESWQNVEDRVAAFAREILERHAGETIVIVSHEGPLMVLLKYLKGLSVDEITDLWEESRTFSPGLLGGFAEPTNIYVDARTGKEIDPHRPFIDDMSLTCECGNSSIGSGQGEMKRVKEVMDVWFDSGAMPFAQDADKRGWRGTRINADKKKVARGFFQNIPYPADFISEAIDQTRGWFYTLHAIGGLMGRGRAYKNVICLGHILDAEGKKMSKSLGNIVEPRTMIEKYGADALRFWMYSVNQPGEPKNFDEKTVDEVVRKVFNLASNVLAFYQLYADKKESRIMNHESRNALDRWILARLNQLIGEVTDGLERYKLLEPTRAIRDFIADLSQWYLRRSRERIKDGGEDGQVALAALGFVLCELSKIMAPFAPFFAEYLYQEVKGQRSRLRRSFGGQAKVKGFPESVHLEEWPQVESRMTNEELRVIQEMEEARRIVSLALEARAKANIKVRQPLASLRIKNHESRIMDQESLLGLIKDEVNVKEITLDQNLAEAILLDTAVTPELKEEGNVRGLVRSIQELRKEAALEPGDKVSLEVAAEGAARAFVEKHKKTITRQTNLSEIVFVASLEAPELIIGDMRWRLRIVK